MSELGHIGKMYEDRKSKKTGKLVSRDEQKGQLIFYTVPEDGSECERFVISEATFRSNWRLAKEGTQVQIPIDEEDPVIKSVEAELAERSEDGAHYTVTVEDVTPLEKKHLEEYLAWRRECIPDSKNEELESLLAKLNALEENK